MEKALGDTVRRFGRLLGKTFCPYALGANIRFAPPWRPQLSVEENTLRLLPRLDRFVASGEARGWDMFVVEVRGTEAIKTLQSFAGLLNRVLHTLAKADPNRKAELTERITEKEWDFVYGGVRFFVPTFAPFYNRAHARYSHDENSAFIAFQPDHCFSRHGIDSKSPDRRQLSESIKEMFERGGVAYDFELVVNSVKALRYVKRQSVADEPVRWWEYDLD